MKKILCILAVLSLLLAGCGSTPAETTAATTTAATTLETTEPTVVADKIVALTFDDGPNTDTMVEMIDLLEEYGVKATFFLIGKNISSANAPALKRAVELGHEIGNHSFNHVNLTELSEDEILAEYQLCQDAIEEYVGVTSKFFRPPFLAVNDTVNSIIPDPYASGYTVGDGTMGSIAADRAYKAITQAYDGAIILMHCYTNCDETLEALHTIIPELRSQGYEFVTVSELFERKGVTPETGIMYTGTDTSK